MNGSVLAAADAMSLALALVIAHRGAHDGERVVLKEHRSGLVELAVLEQTNDLGDVGGDGAALLTHGVLALETTIRFFDDVDCHGHAPFPRAASCGSLRLSTYPWSTLP